MDVKINGKGPYNFVVDTGASQTALSEKLARDLGLKAITTTVMHGVGGSGKVDSSIYRIDRMQLGEVAIKDLPVGTFDDPLISQLADGIIGTAMLAEFIVTIDYERKELILTRPNRFKPKKKWQRIKMPVQDTKPYIATRVVMKDSSTVKVKLLIDSGASHGLILEPDSNDTLKVPSANVSSIIGRGLGGVITGKIGRIGSVDLGKYDVKNVIANFPDPNSYMDTLKTSRLVPRNGAIGGEILSRFKVTFDFPGENLYLKKNSQFKKKFYYNMSGLTLKAKGSKLQHFEITEALVQVFDDQRGFRHPFLALARGCFAPSPQ